VNDLSLATDENVDVAFKLIAAQQVEFNQNFPEPAKFAGIRLRAPQSRQLE